VSTRKVARTWVHKAGSLLLLLGNPNECETLSAGAPDVIDLLFLCINNIGQFEPSVPDLHCTHSRRLLPIRADIQVNCKYWENNLQRVLWSENNVSSRATN
jgi:hypothetical protein